MHTRLATLHNFIFKGLKGEMGPQGFPGRISLTFAFHNSEHYKNFINVPGSIGDKGQQVISIYFFFLTHYTKST